MTATVIVLGGAGDMGSTLCRHLARSAAISHLVVADVDAVRAGRHAAELAGTATARVRAAAVDLLSPASTRALFESADFVANAAGPFFRLGVPALEAAIATRTPYLDICDDPEPTREMLALDDDAREAGIGAVIGMGASPGLSNLLASRAAKRLESVIDCFTVWPLDGAETPGGDDPEPLAGSAASAAVVHLMEQISGEVESVRDGRLVREPPLSPLSLDFPGVGAGTALTVGHPEPLTLHRSLGVSGRAANGMLVKKTTGPFLDSLRRDIDAGKLDLESAAREFVDPSAMRSARALAGGLRAEGPGRLPAFFALLRGRRDGHERWVGCRATTLPSGMAGVTSIPAAIGVERLLAVPAAPGVHPPEAALSANHVLDALRPHCPGEPTSLDDLAPLTERDA